VLFAYTLSVILCPAALPREEWGAPQVTVREDSGKWIISGKKQVVTLDRKTLAIDVQADPAHWAMAASAPNALLARSQGKDFPWRLAEARRVIIQPYDTGFKTGIKIALSGWRAASATGGSVDLDLYLTICLEGKDEDLVFDIAATEKNATIRQLDWPPALDASTVDYTILSNVRGVLLPRDYPKPYFPIRASNSDGSLKTNDTSEIQSNVIEDWSMSWWGFQKGRSSMMVIVETPDDAAYQFNHPAGGPTVIGPRWRASLGKLGYVRTARMCFFPDGDYVTLAKRYRRYATETGLFVSLREKIAREPIVKELIARPIMRAGILTNYKPEGDRAKRTPDASERYHMTTFDDRAKFLREVKSNGLEKLTVVLTGWPRMGYDRQHPDVLPPAPEAGGWEGMKRLAETCKELGYLFSLHDQYRDYYVDAPSYDPQFAIHEEDEKSRPQAFPGTRFGDFKEGDIPFMDHWDGGKMSYLNGRFMLGHLVKNYQWLFDRGIQPQGNYLDVFGYVPPDEDFNPEHPTTRTDCLRERIKCYNWSRAHLGFVGTEAACDWTVPFCDVSSPLSQKKGIPAPLFNLVYHDAIITTYAPDDLHGFLNGGLPQVRAHVPSKEELEQIRRMCALHRRVALLEMTKHEFLDSDHKMEQTTFADGTTVKVDWESKTAQIRPDLNLN
jgi:hypothetical protein